MNDEDAGRPPPLFGLRRALPVACVGLSVVR
jgi:hypothetical protein